MTCRPAPSGPCRDSHGPLGVLDGAIELLLKSRGRAAEALNDLLRPVDVFKPALD